MMQKLAVFSCMVLSASCMVLHQAQPVSLGVQYYDTPNYNFAYEVNDAHTGDIKNQHESRRGDTVLGQYSLLQPDGVRRTVDYRADELAGFRATVNNEGRHSNNQGNNIEAPRQAQVPASPVYLWTPAAQTAPPAPAVAVSRSSIVQTFSSPVQVHAPIQSNQYSNQVPIQSNQYSNQYSNPWV